MTKRIRFSAEDQVIRDLLYLKKQSDAVRRVPELISTVTKGSGFSAIVKHVATGLPDSSVDVERILTTVQNLQRSQMRLQVVPEELIDSLAGPYEAACKEDNRLSASEWKDMRELVVSVLKALSPDNPLFMARKAEKLIYSHQHVLNEARIITDLRPVFDHAADKLIEAVVTHTLLIDYLEIGSQHRIEFALDANDLSDLRMACERAERKAVSLRDAVKDMDWPTKLGLDED